MQVKAKNIIHNSKTASIIHSEYSQHNIRQRSQRRSPSVPLLPIRMCAGVFTAWADNGYHIKSILPH